MAAPAFKTPLNPPNLCPEIPTLPNLDRPLGILPAKEKCRSWIYSTLLPVLGIPSLLELLHAPPETAATATAALQINNKSSLKSCKSLTTTTTIESMSTSNAMQSAVVSATDEAPSPHCTASREQERKDGHAIWRQIATVILKKEIIMSETTRQKFSS